MCQHKPFVGSQCAAKGEGFQLDPPQEPATNNESSPEEDTGLEEKASAHCVTKPWRHPTAPSVIVNSQWKFGSH